MENERILNESGINSKWTEAAREMLAFDCGLREQTEYYSQRLISSVINGHISIEELRAGVAWANALDREIVERCDDIESLGSEDRIEAFSRRIAHHSGRIALKQVGSNTKMLVTIATRRKRTVLNNNSGMFSLEPKDLTLQEF